MKTIVEIEWDSPKEQDWLCAKNIEIALSEHCKNTKFKVKEFCDCDCQEGERNCVNMDNEIVKNEQIITKEYVPFLVDNMKDLLLEAIESSNKQDLIDFFTTFQHEVNLKRKELRIKP